MTNSLGVLNNDPFEKVLGAGNMDSPEEIKQFIQDYGITPASLLDGMENLIAND